MEESRKTELLAKARELEENRDDLWTWLDNDPSVAWTYDLDLDRGQPIPYHGRLRALYLEADWKMCYHNDGAHFHFDVKVKGNGPWRGFHTAQANEQAKRRGLLDTDRLEGIANGLGESDREFWWEDATDHVRYELGHRSARIYSCGRSGGYLNAAALETDPTAMVELAAWCSSAREYANSEDAGRETFERALEEYDDIALEALASPRSERIEA